MESTWEARDLVVLDAAVRYLDERGPAEAPMASELAGITGLPEDDVVRALVALEGAYVDLRKPVAPLAYWRVTAVTPAARFAVGQWPTPESVADRLTAAIEQAAESAPDEEQRGRLRRTADWFRNAGRDVLVEVAAAVVTRGIPGG